MSQTSLFSRKPRHNRAQRRFLMWTVIPMVLYMAFWTLFPLLWGFALAFFDYSSRRAGGPVLGLGGDNPFIGLQNFTSMLNFSEDAPLTVRPNQVQPEWCRIRFSVPSCARVKHTGYRLR